MATAQDLEQQRAATEAAGERHAEVVGMLEAKIEGLLVGATEALALGILAVAGETDDQDEGLGQRLHDSAHTVVRSIFDAAVLEFNKGEQAAKAAKLAGAKAAGDVADRQRNEAVDHMLDPRRRRRG